MKRSELAHILRAASTLAKDPHILVIGSQSILGSFSEDELPPEATRSIEADVAFFDDAGEEKADAVDGGIGEISRFHESNGVYGQGVGISTASLPAGWRDRLVPFDDPEASSSSAYCLDPHDLVVSKLVAGREKDFEFARALLEAHLVDPAVLSTRAELLPELPGTKRRIIRWVQGAAERLAKGREADP